MASPLGEKELGDSPRPYKVVSMLLRRLGVRVRSSAVGPEPILTDGKRRSLGHWPSSGQPPNLTDAEKMKDALRLPP